MMKSDTSWFTGDLLLVVCMNLPSLLKSCRRSLNEKILVILKDEGTFSTMHTLLLYLQNATLEQSPIVAGLLLQLDLLVLFSLFSPSLCLIVENLCYN